MLNKTVDKKNETEKPHQGESIFYICLKTQCSNNDDDDDDRATQRNATND